MKNYILLALQFLIVYYIIFLSGWLPVYTFPFVTIQLLSVLLIFWAILVNWLHKKPASKKTSRRIYLLKEGPYEFLRFPIDAGFLLFISTYVQEYFTLTRSLAFILFVVLGLLRLQLEEKSAEARFKNEEYIEYKKTTKKLIPYLY